MKVGGEWNFDETEDNVGNLMWLDETEENVGNLMWLDEEGDEDIGWKKDLTKPFDPCPGCGQWRL